MPRRDSCMAAATSRTVIPFGFSLDTLLFMKPNESRPAVSRSVGKTRVPAQAHDDLVAGPHFDHGQAGGVHMLGVDHDSAVHLLPVDLNPGPPEADLRILVRRRVKALGKSTVHVGRHEAAILLIQGDGPVAADRRQQLFQVLGRGPDHPQLAHSWDRCGVGRREFHGSRTARRAP